MIYTITFNPSLDYVISVDDFQSGKINRTVKESLFAGGKGINVSYVLNELGVESTALGFVAGFTGIELKKRICMQGINVDFICVQEGMTRINVKMKSQNKILSKGKTSNLNVEMEETEINGQGPIVSEDELRQLVAKVEQLSKDDILVVSGSVSQGVPQSIYADIVKLCNEKEIRVVVDASSVLLWNVLEQGPFLIKPNKDELEDLFYRDIETQDEVIFYARELQNRGAKNVLVSLGKEGAVLIAEDGQVYEMGAPQGTVINSVGAGDSMVAGFLAGYLESKDYEEALKLGVCVGSATAFSEGLATKTDIDKWVLKK